MPPKNDKYLPNRRLIFVFPEAGRPQNINANLSVAIGKMLSGIDEEPSQPPAANPGANCGLELLHFESSSIM